MKFTNIIWLLVCSSLAIGLINSMGIFSTNYMTEPEGTAWELTDVQGTLANETLTSDADMGATNPFMSMAMLKDLVLGCFYVYDPLVNMWRVPAALAAVLQTIVAISWTLFFVQLISRFSWGGIES